MKKSKEQKIWEKRNLFFYQRHPRMPLYISIVALSISILALLLKMLIVIAHIAY